MDTITNLWNNLENSLGVFIPTIIAVILILIIGLFIAKIIKKIVKNVIKKTGVDDKLKSNVKLSDFVSKLVYLLVLIFVFILALNKLGMTEVLDPLKNMLNGFLSFIPNIIGAGLVGYVGYMLAKIISELVAMSGDTIQNMAPKLKLPENINLVKIITKVVFIIIFVPILIAALNILNMDAISVPASLMLSQLLSSIPKIIMAMLILIIFIVGARFVSDLVKDLLNSMNLNEFAKKIELDSIIGNANIVSLIGKLVYFFIVLFGIMTAVEKLEFQNLTEILETVTSYAGKIIFGLVILAIGNWIASIAYKNFAKNEDNKFIGAIVRVAIIAIFLAIGLRTMGIADDIINLAFGITLGTVAVTIALSFGLGGREAAGKQMHKIIDKFNSKTDSK
ncbi:mechanosensitive ion channel [Patiriisocius marinus]|uniref:mechanosensitive ion channel n=1 Tax=Patiriisocius marinus TaxID=1397112 RepID=UPI00232EBC5B|nr:mechanosensitive ion channel [Patiriisocius marinus]